MVGAHLRMNDALLDLYHLNWMALNQIRRNDKDISWPLLIKVPPEYALAKRRLVIVGQQTYGWDHFDGNQEDPVHWLTEAYAAFALGQGYHASPFWQASHQLYESLNPDGAPCGFIWSNLIKVDQNACRPMQTVEEAVCAIGLVPAELQILEPDVIVFFTGPSYDDRLRSTFPTLRFIELTEALKRLEHPSLPYHSYRTPHPKYLRISHQWDTLHMLANQVVSKCCER